VATTAAKNVALIGCGNISDIYFENCAKLDGVQAIACSDLDMERARAKADKHGIATVGTTREILADERIDIVLNLTVPQAHAGITLAALEAGKHVYSEKPLAVSRDDGRRIVDLARERGLRVGCAPDTFLGGGLQTCRKLIDDGAIGRPVAASAFMLCPGHEMWHPSPEFFYKPGGGPMFDMGPYYVTALVTLLGPVASVCGSTASAHAERTITSQPHHGKIVTVEIPTHVAGIMNFTAGAVATIVTSFDVWHHNMPCLEIYGTQGSLSVPDPNSFGGPVRLRSSSDREWREVPLTHGYAENCRGVGLADMANGLRSGRAHRASGDLAFHVLEIMHAFHQASDQRRNIALEHPCDRPAPLPLGLTDGQLDP
jgi:predicted dehydrogenase